MAKPKPETSKVEPALSQDELGWLIRSASYSETLAERCSPNVAGTINTNAAPVKSIARKLKGRDLMAKGGT